MLFKKQVEELLGQLEKVPINEVLEQVNLDATTSHISQKGRCFGMPVSRTAL